MTRIHASHHSQLGANRTSAIDRTKVVRKKKPYKIVLEAVTKEKKKLHSVLSYNADAPRGYSFVPVGHPQLTEYCKDRCRERNLDVHIVSAKPKNRAILDPEKLSNHVHRVGHHFPNDVVEEACDALGYYYRNGVIQKSTRTLDSTRLARSLADYGQRMRLHNRPITEVETRDQIRGAVRDLFPKIPVWDLEAIVAHAFEEGTNRVGNAKELSIARRVQLAVVAHIRHNYTDYDKLLKTGTWFEARTKVEHVSLAKLKEWRDENDNDEIEETFREVIILDDDDEEDDESEGSLVAASDREHSLEIVSSRAPARELPVDEIAYVSRAQHRAPGRLVYAQRQPLYAHGQLPRAHARPFPPVIERGYEPFHNSGPRLRAAQVEMDGRLHNLIPVEDAAQKRPPVRVDNPPAVQYLPNGTVAPYSREGYAQSHQRVHSLNSDPVKPSAPASRRHSEQDIVIPSVEHDHYSSGHLDAAYMETQSPKRRSLHESPYDFEDRRLEPFPKRLRPAHPGELVAARESPYTPVHVRDHMETRTLPTSRRAHDDFIDLTSSPYRPPTSMQRLPDHAAPVYSHHPFPPSSSSYAPESSHRSPLHGSREMYYNLPAREIQRPREPRYYDPATETQISRTYKYVPIREEIPPRVAHEAEYSRSLLHR